MNPFIIIAAIALWALIGCVVIAELNVRTGGRLVPAIETGGTNAVSICAVLWPIFAMLVIAAKLKA